ncbi:MAG: glutamate synthase-related protein [Nitrososphaerota archaeon]
MQISNFILKLFLALHRVYSVYSDLAEIWRSYPFREIIERARNGVDAIYPRDVLKPSIMLLKGANIYKTPTRYATLDELLILPPAFTPLRLKRMSELLREPIFSDVDLRHRIGGFDVSMPVMVASMGSVQVANKVSLEVARGAARMGVPMGVGENVATTWGYSKRIRSSQPCFKERVLTYFEHMNDGLGGVTIQQSVEDAYGELWNRVYSDPDIEPYIQKGLVGFEIKVGQGSKPGLGGEVRLSREEAERLRDKYHFTEDPESSLRGSIERHSAPGTYVPEILRSMLRLMRNNYPRCRIWVKLGPFRDLPEVLDVLLSEGVDAVWIDGKEGGTGMSPYVSMRHLGLPLIAALCSVSGRLGVGNGSSSVIVSGRLYDGGHLVKCLCLGLDGVAFGRPVAVAGWVAGHRGVENYLKTVEIEAKMLISALGKYSVRDLSREDLGCLDRDIAERLGLRYVYG